MTFEIEKEDPIEVGTASKYVITVLNQGGAPASNIQITATVPAEMDVTGAQGLTPFRQDKQQVIFQPLATLDAKKEARYEINVKPLKPGQVRFMIDLKADQLGAQPVHKEQITTIYSQPATVP